MAAGDITVAGVVRVPTAIAELRFYDGDWAECEPGVRVPVPVTRRGCSGGTPWTATPGSHRLQVRATDGDGETQTMEAAPPAPLTECRGKYHTRSVQVD